jgi:hypothetical protein
MSISDQVPILATLPEKELNARMGREGKRLRQLWRGELPHLFQPTEPAFGRPRLGPKSAPSHRNTGRRKVKRSHGQVLDTVRSNHAEVAPSGRLPRS